MKVAALVLLLFLAALLEIWIWAVAYLSLGALTGMESALYFSAVTFTTLGYGDVVLDSSWRLLASFEAVNGIIMFGWSTALLVALVQRLREPGAARRSGQILAQSLYSAGYRYWPGQYRSTLTMADIISY
jgi:voltage-gated potassium channel Kch